MYKSLVCFSFHLNAAICIPPCIKRSINYQLLFAIRAYRSPCDNITQLRYIYIYIFISLPFVYTRMMFWNVFMRLSHVNHNARLALVYREPLGIFKEFGGVHFAAAIGL